MEKLNMINQTVIENRNFILDNVLSSFVTRNGVKVHGMDYASALARAGYKLFWSGDKDVIAAPAEYFNGRNTPFLNGMMFFIDNPGEFATMKGEVFPLVVLSEDDLDRAADMAYMITDERTADHFRVNKHLVGDLWAVHPTLPKYETDDIGILLGIKPHRIK